MESEARAPATAGVLLEYVSSPGCSDCRTLETLIARVVPDYPTVVVRKVAADSARGLALSVGRGILRFPVIVLADEVLAIESIGEVDLRTALTPYGVGAR